MTDLFKDNLTAKEIEEILSSHLTKKEEIKSNKSPIQKLAEEKRWDLVEVFAKFPVNSTQETQARYGSALLIAVIADKFDLAGKLLKAGASTHYYQPRTGNNLLHFLLMKEGQEELLTKVIDVASLATLKLKNKADETPILLAAKSGRWDVVQRLAAKLGKTNINDSLQYQEVSQLAKNAGKQDVVQQLESLKSEYSWETITVEQLRTLLQSMPAIREEKMSDGKNPIEKLAEEKRWDLVAVFAEFPVNSSQEAQARYGSALLDAVIADKFELAGELLKAGAATHYYILRTGNNLLHFLLMKEGQEELLTKVIDVASLATLKLKNKAGETPILLAAKSGRWDVVQRLAAKLGKTNINDSLQYQEVIKLAEKAGKKDVVQQLESLKSEYSWETITVEQLRTLLQSMPAIREEKMSDGKNPIEKLAEEKRWDLVAVFTEFPVSSSQEAQARYGSALLDAVIAEKFELAGELLKAGAATHYYILRTGNNLLHFLLMKEGQEELLTKVIDVASLATLKLKNKAGETPILLAAKSGRWDVVKLLATKLGKTNINDSLQYQEVSKLAEKEGKKDIVQQLESLKSEYSWETITVEQLRTLLQSMPAIREEKVSDGKNPIEKSLLEKRWDFIAVFAEFPVNSSQEAQARYGSALLCAVIDDKFELAEKLLKAGAATHYYMPGTGNNLLHFLLMKKGQDELLTKVIDVADEITLKLKNKAGETPILLAAKLGHWDVVKYLADKSGRIDITALSSDDKQYKEVIRLAIENNHLEIVDQLISYGPLQQNSEGLTPLMTAVKNKDIDLINQVLSYKIFTTADCIKAYSLAQEHPDAYPVETIQRLKESVDKGFFSEFQKIYGALYDAQSSLFKQKKNTCSTWEDVLEYVQQHPHSRSAEAVELTKKFIETNDKKALVKAVHQFGYEHSSSLGLFKRSKNKQGLEENFEETYDTADENSRTGVIRRNLK
ncbi:ankyrin repeat domain-containing protein [Legionella brunensis]|nr:ankyrin repeat domain-containing protein [Legionella brunensis]